MHGFFFVLMNHVCTYKHNIGFLFFVFHNIFSYFVFLKRRQHLILGKQAYCHRSATLKCLQNGIHSQIREIRACLVLGKT